MRMMREGLSARELEILHLLAEGAADKEIASRLHLSLNTVKWHNRQIYAKLGVENRTKAVKLAGQKRLLGEDPTPEPPVSLIPHNLPAALSSFVGREKEMVEIKELLETNRLVTLTGTAGVGKTRLALELARHLLTREAYPEGIFYVDLAQITRWDQVQQAILEGLDLITNVGDRPHDVLNRFLQDKHLLLIVDNFEHLLDSVLILKELLSAASLISILVTSREPLRLGGEQVFTLDPLPESDAVDLFIQRSRAITAKFDPEGEMMPVLAEVCKLLDHLPLALELAAARTKILSLEKLLDQLDDRFSLLRSAPRDFPERHRTLQKAIDWSYSLLEPEEQAFFRRLGVFRGGCNLDAAAALGCFDLQIDVLDGLESLLDKNLIQMETGYDGESRFLLLKILRGYARNRLREAGELADLQRRHGTYFTALAAGGKISIRGGPDQIHWLKRLQADLGNLRSVLVWSLEEENDPVLGARLVSGLETFWDRACHFYEGEYWTSQAMGVLDQLPPEVQAGVYAAGGLNAYYMYDFPTSKSRIQRALEIYEELGNEIEIGWMRVFKLFPMRINAEDHQEMQASFTQAVEFLQRSGDKAALSQAYAIFGSHQDVVGNQAEAREAIQSSSEINKEVGDSVRDTFNLLNMGYIILQEGDALAAQRYFQESLRLELSLDWVKVWATGTLIALAQAALALENWRRTVVLLSSANVLWKRRGLRPWPMIGDVIDQIENELKGHISHEEYQEAWEEGQALALEEIFVHALEGLPQAEN